MSWQANRRTSGRIALATVGPVDPDHPWAMSFVPNPAACPPEATELDPNSQDLLLPDANYAMTPVERNPINVEHPQEA